MTTLADAEQAVREPDEPARTGGSSDPVVTAVRLRPPERRGMHARFDSTDPNPGWDVARHPKVARLLRNRRFQFMLILPNQIVFWAVILLGLAGTVVPGLNFGTAITWYLWFCLVFVMMVVVGRAWCAMCPFGGFGEWVQRQAFWKRTQKALGLGLKLPEPVARYGFLMSVVSFLVLTWIEETFNIAGPGAPHATSWMVVGIVSSALVFFLAFERRTFCRYVCPLSALIGTVGAMGSVAGFRTRDREVCLSCETKDCMRGSSSGYGCPWYTWPGSADSNLACGLCSECYKSCPSDNIGLFLQKPMTSVVAPTRRRFDIAWAVAVLWGLVVFQQVNATNVYASADSWLNRNLHMRYPDPLDYVGIIAAVALVMGGIAWLVQRALGRRDLEFATPGRNYLDRTSRFRAFFVPLMYGLIPVVGADYFARQLPKFFSHVPRLVPAVGAWFGAGSTHSPLYSYHLLETTGIVVAQVAVIGLGTLGAVFASWRIAGRDLASISTRPGVARVTAVGLALACGVVAGVLYIAMHAAP
ncbi:MAG: 4Fe-4S binding protein [Actinomycetota bacterium]|nr:4Fe-4S binding protein [Actinomycetota bacterium]